MKNERKPKITVRTNGITGTEILVDGKRLAARVKELKEDPLWDNEMQGHTDEYLDYVKRAAMAFELEPHASWRTFPPLRRG